MRWIALVGCAVAIVAALMLIGVGMLLALAKFATSDSPVGQLRDSIVPRPADDTVRVALTTRRENGQLAEWYTPGETVEVYLAAAKRKPDTRLVLEVSAIHVPGVRSNAQVAEVPVVWDDSQAAVRVALAPRGGAWLIGKYRLTVYIDGRVGTEDIFYVLPP